MSPGLNQDSVLYTFKVVCVMIVIVTILVIKHSKNPQYSQEGIDCNSFWWVLLDSIHQTSTE